MIVNIESQRDEDFAAHFQLGMNAQEQGDFPEAKKWYLKSLAISEQQGDEHFVSISCHKLELLMKTV